MVTVIMAVAALSRADASSVLAPGYIIVAFDGGQVRPVGTLRVTCT